MVRRQRDATEIVQSSVADSVFARGPGLWGVACSGGVDSMVLAHALRAVVGPRRTVVLHIHHGLQNQNDVMLDQVRTWARRNGVAFAAKRVVVPAAASLEAQARTVRYRALYDLCSAVGVGSLATAHQLEDLAETVLMRILRGTGPAGLAAMRQDGGFLVRPLLAVSRTAIEEYAQTHQLPIVEDPMNESRTHLRVRIRSELLPWLRNENPQIELSLAQLARLAGEWSDTFDWACEQSGLGAMPWESKKVRELPASLVAHAFSRELAKTGMLASTSAHNALQRALNSDGRGSKRFDFQGGAIWASYGKLALHSGRATPSPSAVLQLESLVASNHVVVRTWRQGDRFMLRNGGSKKVSDLFIDRKIARHLREQAAVVVDPSDDAAIWWVEHIGCSRICPKSLSDRLSAVTNA